MVAASTIVQGERERLGVSQRQLAQALGLHERTVTRWELGLFQPHPIWLSRIRKMKREDFDGVRIQTDSTIHDDEVS